MNPEEIEELINSLIEKARRTHTGEMSFCEFAARLRFELKQLAEKEVQKDETPEA